MSYPSTIPNTDATTLSPLPLDLHKSLIAVSSLGFLSFVCSTSLFCYLTYRFISWSLDRKNRPSAYRTNQFLVLIYNLLLADIQQSLAFLLNISAVRNNAINVDMPTCWAQGWFVSTGDLASSVWIFAIALHTFLIVVKNYKVPQFWFYVSIVGLWIFVYAMALIGVAMHPHNFYVRAGPWCWINSIYDELRLWLHYLWIFICMFGTVMIYALIVTTLQIRLHMRENPSHCPFRNSSNVQKKSTTDSQLKSQDTAPSISYTHPLTNLNNRTAQRATKYLILYPLIYVICTIPLAAGRMAAMTGVAVSDHYFCIAGGMIASAGFLDVILYGFTRGSLVFGWRDAEGRGVDAGRLESFMWYYGSGPMWRDGAGGFGTITVIEGGGNAEGESGEGDDGVVKNVDGRRPSGFSMEGDLHTPLAIARMARTNAISHLTRTKSTINGNKKLRRGTTASTEDLYHRGSSAGNSSLGINLGFMGSEMYMAGIKTETTVDVKIGERRGGPYELRDVGNLGGGDPPLPLEEMKGDRSIP